MLLETYHIDLHRPPLTRPQYFWFLFRCFFVNTFLISYKDTPSCLRSTVVSVMWQARPSLTRNLLYDKRYHVQCAKIEVNKMHKQIEEIRNVSRRQGCPYFCKNAYSHKAKMAYLYKQIAINFGAIGITSKEKDNLKRKYKYMYIVSRDNHWSFFLFKFQNQHSWHNDQFWSSVLAARKEDV